VFGGRTRHAYVRELPAMLKMGVEIAADLPDIDHALLPLPTTGTPPEATSTHGKLYPFRAFTTGQPMPFAASVIRRPNPFVEMMMGVGVGTVTISSSKLGPGIGAVSDPHPTAGYLAPLLPRLRKLYSCCHGDRDARPVGRVWAISQLQLDKWVKLTPKDGRST
jgi:hypothetical protein